MKIVHSTYFAPGVHITIWVLLLSVPGILFWKQSFLGLSQRFFFLTTLFHIGFFYFNAYYLYPRLLTKRWWWLYIISLFVLIMVSYKAKVLFLELDPTFLLTEINKRVIFFPIIPFVIAGILFRLISDRLRFERLEKEATAQRLDAELKFLRSQVSPHFLFNMLTNFVSLARQKSEVLEPSLIKMSELLRYMLYDSTEGKMKVDKEIENIKNYIALQQLRFGEDVELELKIKNEGSRYLIEPMLLVPFIENAYKHGVGLLKDPYIKVEINIHENKLDFQVTNNYNADNLSKDKNKGIGLTNVKNRLELLYPQKYALRISDKNSVFFIHLTLELS